jgi:hypothetical protein
LKYRQDRNHSDGQDRNLQMLKLRDGAHLVHGSELRRARRKAKNVSPMVSPMVRM